MALERERIVRRGQLLTWATLGYNTLEGLVAVWAGLLAGSISLVGFGIDSAIEVAASVAALWRLHVDRDSHSREQAERRTLRVIGVSFLALACYVTLDAIQALRGGEEPAESLIGIALACASLVVMPLLARRKRRVAKALSSSALAAEARQTEICVYLSVILLAGLALNATMGWWWADPVAALAMVPLIAWEGVEGLRGRRVCDDCAPL